MINATFMRRKSYPPPINLNILCAGNSLTLGTANNPGKSYPTLVSESSVYIDNNWSIYNDGVNSATMEDISARYEAQILSRYDANKNNVIVLWEGTNDVYYGATGYECYQNYLTYTQAAQADGFKVIWLSSLPRFQVTAWVTPAELYNQRLLDFDEYLRINKSQCDGLVHLRSRSELATITSTYYTTDNVHLLEAGYAVVAEEVIEVLSKLRF